MHHLPDLPEFLELAKHHRLVPVYRQLVGDTLTPVTAFRKIQDGDWSFLFESVIGGERVGRYSFLGSAPFFRFQAWDRRVLIEDLRPTAVKTVPVQETSSDDPLRLLEETLDRFH